MKQKRTVQENNLFGLYSTKIFRNVFSTTNTTVPITIRAVKPNSFRFDSNVDSKGAETYIDSFPFSESILFNTQFHLILNHSAVFRILSPLGDWPIFKEGPTGTLEIFANLCCDSDFSSKNFSPFPAKKSPGLSSSDSRQNVLEWFNLHSIRLEQIY